jgi:hypothetical protein
MSVEASELLELFLWKNPADVKRSMKSDPEFTRRANACQRGCNRKSGASETADAAFCGEVAAWSRFAWN